MGYEVLTFLSLLTIGLSGVLILAGLVFIKTGRRELHKKAMISASLLALLFLVFYGAKYFLYPPKYYEGPHRTLYLFILISHSVLAAVNLPLAAFTVFLGLTGRYSKHRRIAPITAAVWIYVAVTGWLIFFFLHGGEVG
jgi:putative membrane protein